MGMTISHGGDYPFPQWHTDLVSFPPSQRSPSPQTYPVLQGAESLQCGASHALALLPREPSLQMRGKVYAAKKVYSFLHQACNYNNPCTTCSLPSVSIISFFLALCSHVPPSVSSSLSYSYLFFFFPGRQGFFCAAARTSATNLFIYEGEERGEEGKERGGRGRKEGGGKKGENELFYVLVRLCFLGVKQTQGSVVAEACH